MATVENIRTDATSKTEEAKIKTRETAEQTKDQAKGMAAQTQEKAKEVAHEAKDQAKSAVATGKDRAAGELQNVAQAFRQAGESLRNQNKENVAHYTEQVAQQVERVSGYLNEKDVTEILGEAERFARRQPGAFLAGAFAAGLLIGRFLKSSNGQQNDLARRGYYEPGDYEPYPQTYKTTATTARPTTTKTRPETYGNPGVTGTKPGYPKEPTTPPTTPNRTT